LLAETSFSVVTAIRVATLTKKKRILDIMENGRLKKREICVKED
jgi:hypothetical protein